MATSELKFNFDAVYYHVSDMDRSIAFYRDVLGFKLTSRDYGVLFELVPNPPGHSLPGDGNARLCLGVTDMREATRELNARGVSTVAVKQEEGGLLSFFKDPDGNEISLWQYTH